MSRRVICVGDIHGMLDELIELLEKCRWTPGVDRLIFAGDLVDRGPNSAGVIDFAMKHNVTVTVGNHDDKYIRYRRHEVKEKNKNGYQNPMSLRSEKAKVWETLTDEHLAFLEAQPYILPIPEYNSVVVHAGVLPNRSLTEQNRRTCLFVRYVDEKTFEQRHLGPNFTQPPGSVHWTSLYTGAKDIVYGHDVQSITEPVIKTNKNGGRTIGIDTGACFGGRLTAFIYSKQAKRGEIVQVQSKYTYKDFKIVGRNNK